MTIAVLCWMVAIPLLGFCTGLRTMLPMAVLCWFGYRHQLPVHHSWAFWTTMLVSAIVFTVLALGELVGDKLPNTPNRTALFPLIARVAFGGLVGAVAATALHGAAPEGILLGALGALAGTFTGYQVRHWLTTEKGAPDLVIALVEDGFTLVASVFALSLITG